MKNTTQNSALPEYAVTDEKSPVVNEKEGTFDSQECKHGAESQTPFIDGLLRKPQAQDALLALSKAFSDAAEGERCLKCTVDDVVPPLRVCMENIKKAKKNGDFTKEEKKELKKELKWLFKGYKQGAWSMWRNEA